MKWLLFLLIVYLAMSMITIVVYAIDKAAARKQQRRLSERTLQGLALACGWPGAIMAQQWLRHKTQKQSFRVVFWLMVVLNLGLLAALLWYVL